jgi:L-glyceraldehyde reductase
MIKLLDTGKVKAIGVSNFNIKKIEGIIDATGVVPVVNQIEAHPRLPQDELVEFCKQKNIHITAYSPLGNNGNTQPINCYFSYTHISLSRW